MQDLNRRVAVITGGASGIGLATARRLAAEGMRLVLADLHEPSLREACSALEREGAEVLGVVTDVGERSQVEALADRAFSHFGGVHLLFNNAGIAVSGRVWETSHEDWEWTLRVNLWGVIHGVESFVPRMLEQSEPGHVLATASFAGLVPNFGLGAYCVSKYGVVALMECLSRELRGTQIGASVLCPMMVSTGIFANSERDRPGAQGAAAPEPQLGSSDAGPPVGTVLEAAEVAERVLRAVRDDELYIVTHEDARAPVQRRFARIDGAFEQV
jgi:NAD(P)-dependent dehydrogenase (short-subunit alcohol dehydrogenase family)